jgi:hypothetical protein
MEMAVTHAHREGRQEVNIYIAEKCGGEGGQNFNFWQCSEDSNLSVIRGLEVTFETSITENV